MHEIFWLQESQGFTRWHPPSMLQGLGYLASSYSRLHFQEVHVIVNLVDLNI
jgi:hypothetical protein